MDVVTVTMKQKKETPGTIMYATEEHPGITTLYIRKGTFKKMPEVIRVTVEANPRT